MRVTTLIKAAALAAFLAGTAAAGVKYVAVVETDVDAASGASAELNAAEVREITAELRRQATENLPSGKYSVMTSETVQSMGGAVLEECAEENCVITLGSRIGADYIVRGTVSKFQTKFTLTIEIYETDNGTLVISSEAVRSGNLEELLGIAATASANMYRKFADTQKTTAAAGPAPDTDEPKEEAKPEKEMPTPKPKSEPPKRPPITLSVGGGAFFNAGFGGGIKWPSGAAAAMPYFGGGVYLFFDATYGEAFAGYSMGGGKWKSEAVSDSKIIPDMKCQYINIGVFAKYPVNVGSVKLFPLFGIDYEAAAAGKLEYEGGGKTYEFDGADGRYNSGDLSIVWVKFGGGVDFDLGERLYLRGELMYGVRSASEFEKGGAAFDDKKGETMRGQCVSVRVGAGFRF